MDPRRGENLSPFAGITRPDSSHGPGSLTAFLCLVLRLKPMTDPAIAGIAVSATSVLAATPHDPLFDPHLGALQGFEPNLRGWREAYGADPDMVDALVVKLRRAGH